VRQFKWGIIAPGGIARVFAADLGLIDSGDLTAVGSRDVEKARAFADEFGSAGTASYGTYAEVANDPDVDVVYVANPHAFHADAVLACLEAGKPVLCEKPLTLNARTSGELVAAARARKVFLMEAMWMRCNPNIRAMTELVADGVIGEVRSVAGDYGFYPGQDGLPRYSDPQLGASTLLDIGVYLLNFAWTFLGPPAEVRAVGTLSPDHIDKSVAIAMRYESGATAALDCTFEANTPGHAYVGGTLGHLAIREEFQRVTEFTLTTADGSTSYSEPLLGHGFTHEIEEVHRCLAADATESPLVPLDDTVAIMATMDTIRSQIGSVLPGD